MAARTVMAIGNLWFALPLQRACALLLLLLLFAAMQRTPATSGGNNAIPACHPTGSEGGSQGSAFVRSRLTFFSRRSAGETKDPVDGTTSPAPPEQVAAEALQTGRPASSEPHSATSDVD